MTAKRSVLLLHGMASSRKTWWRVGPALVARGWDVDTVDLAGHGGRPIGTARSVAALAEDVAAQRPDGATVIVGHSLGAVVALQLVVTHPAYARGVLLEDPPGLGRPRVTAEMAAEIEQEVSQARADPGAAIATILRGHSTWSRRDARSILEGRLLTDPLLARLSPGGALTWDLSALVSSSPVAVALVAAVGGYSALFEPTRSELLRLLPAERVTEIPGSHHLHLDEPAGFVDAVHAFGASLL